MNPIEMIRLIGLWGKFKALAKEKGSFMSKLSQYVHLAVTLAGVIGVPTLAGKWLDQPVHATIFAVLVGVSVLLHAMLPSIFGAPSDNAQAEAGLTKAGMILFCLLVVPSCFGQTATSDSIQNLYAAGVSYNVNASPGIAGTGLYARLVAGSGTYAFTAVDALPTTVKPFSVTTNIGAGIAQKLTSIGKVDIYVPTAAGISWSGTNTGWQWNGGAIAAIPLKNAYYLMPTIRFLKSSVSGGSDYQPIIGVLFGLGK